MEIIYVVLLLIIIYLLITGKNENNSRINDLDFRLAELQRLLQQKDRAATKEESVIIHPPVEVIAPPPPKPPAPVVKPENVEWHAGVISDSTTPPKPLVNKQVFIEPEPELSFFERYPDLEKFIGENLVNKIGIAILVLAIGFFVKYAIDNNWIGPVGRVGIGVLCGGILIGIAHTLRNSYKAFSSVLVGGGLAVLYFTITLAYHQFHLFDQTPAFIIMIVITAFAVALSLLYNKQELAVIALIGGLSSPFLVSNGNANYSALFIYLVVLNTGLMVIAYNKLWRILNATAFGLTVMVVGGVIYSLTDKTYVTGFIYSTVLYLLFFFINVANNIRENKKFIAIDFSILLINTALYFAAGLYLLTVANLDQYRGLFSAGLAVVNLVLSFILFRNRKVDTNVLYLLIGITLTFISLTAPIQLHGHNITLFWAAESVLLYWLYQRSGIKLMQLTSALIWVAMLISVMMDWTQVYGFSGDPLTVLANKGFVTTVVAAVSSYLLFMLSRKDKEVELYGTRVSAAIYQCVAYLLLFLSGLLEINHQFQNHYPDTSLNYLYLGLYIPAFIFAAYMMDKRWSKTPVDWRISGTLLAAALVVYVLFNQAVFDAQFNILELRKASGLHFIAHWVAALFAGMLFYRVIMINKANMPGNLKNSAAWILAAGIVLFLSMEGALACNQLFYKKANDLDNIQTVYIKVGLPILWGLSSFAMMWLGMRYKERSLRIISLSLFSITLIKLFVFDIRNIPPAGKIAAFFCLGVLLLIISFMYQRVKKIIIDDAGTKEE